MTVIVPKRHPNVEHRRVPLSESRADLQVQRGLYTVQRGEKFAIPVDRLSAPKIYLNRSLWRQDDQGRVFRPGVKMEPTNWTFPDKAKVWLAEHVHEDIPYWIYMLTMGHDVHTSTHGDLWAKHYHRNWVNPFNPELLDAPLDVSEAGQSAATIALRRMVAGSQGFVEDCGWVSGGKVVNDHIVQQTGAYADAAGSGDSAAWNDYNEHEVGTDATAEDRDQSALIATSGIALTAGTQVDNGAGTNDSSYTTVATITADATETWEEEGVFETPGDVLMDRSTTGGQSVNSSDQVQYTYTITTNSEA